ncbi:Chemotaxis protein CheW [Bacillus sp. THAF10]|uniref:chemotaxis protein CheW n=1 Tax=Bacillus sp. THAF10 TaxID=2587848 RepID=UPI0012680469|nr:chemotaxis protein CheW [Bacillus sp. THAF10]QFT89692.1 Chemotaxis protein CheW [Bacillus sp. THAF10]
MESKKLVIFESSKEEYGISVEHVISIEKLSALTVLPEMPAYLKGVMKVRNELIPVLDTKRILFSDNLTVTDKTRLIVVQTSSISAGLLVEDAKEILDVQPEAMQELSMLAQHSTPYIKAMVNLESRLIAVLDPYTLIMNLANITEIEEAVEKHKATN